jgi:hypothetical protein
LKPPMRHMCRIVPAMVASSLPHMLQPQHHAGAEQQGAAARRMQRQSDEPVFDCVEGMNQSAIGDAGCYPNLRRAVQSEEERTARRRTGRAMRTKRAVPMTAASPGRHLNLRKHNRHRRGEEGGGGGA